MISRFRKFGNDRQKFFAQLRYATDFGRTRQSLTFEFEKFEVFVSNSKFRVFSNFFYGFQSVKLLTDRYIIFQYFQADCNKCGEVTKRPKTRPTTQLTRHLKKHSELNAAYTKAKSRKEDEATKKVNNQMRLDVVFSCKQTTVPDQDDEPPNKKRKPASSTTTPIKAVFSKY